MHACSGQSAARRALPPVGRRASSIRIATLASGRRPGDAVRYGVLADIHANLHALRVALSTLERHGVDRYVCAGDLVGYGPSPNECVELVAGLDCVCVAGNHDLIALERLSVERCIPLAQDSLRWTRRVLGDDARAFLAALPDRAATADGVVVAHGSLRDPEEYTTRARQAREQLARVADELPGARVLVLGHTHRPWAYARAAGSLPTRHTLALPDEVIHANPGSVGQSRELRARARCLLLDLDDSSATFLAPSYDVGACRAALRGSGLPERSCHMRPSLPALGRRAIRRLVRSAERLAPRDARAGR